jgi:hypothetical protein
MAEDYMVLALINTEKPLVPLHFCANARQLRLVGAGCARITILSACDEDSPTTLSSLEKLRDWEDRDSPALVGSSPSRDANALVRRTSSPLPPCSQTTGRRMANVSRHPQVALPRHGSGGSWEGSTALEPKNLAITQGVRYNRAYSHSRRGIRGADLRLGSSSAACPRREGRRYRANRSRDAHRHGDRRRNLRQRREAS